MFKSNTEKDTTYETMNLKASEIPKIYIQYQALLKMNQIVNSCSAEVGWLGSVDVVNDSYVITDVYILKQKVTGTTTELDEEALSDLLYHLVETDPEKYNSIKLWGHSHVNMSVTPSSQDDETFREYYGDNPFFIRLIANKKEEMRIDIAIRSTGLIYKKVPWEVIYPEDVIQCMEAYAEVADLLKEAEKSVVNAREHYENQFKNELEKEIKEKVVEERKYYSYYKKDEPKKEEKKSAYTWKDDEMNEYANWYDSYGGYGYYGYDPYYTHLEQIMKKCDTGNLILSRGKKVNLTEAFDPFEIQDIVENCGSWRELENYLKGDGRIASYNKNDWKNLLKTVRETYAEFERRTA